VNLAKKKAEVDCISDYLTMFEEMSHVYNEKNIDDFWYLFMWPPDIKNSVIEGQRKAN